MTSRQCLREITPGRIPANHRRSDDRSATTCGNGSGGVITRHGDCTQRPVPEATDTRPLRRILIAIGLVLVALILVGVAIYAGAFIILAPMMQ